MYEHKDEIISSRVGNLGASDANLIASAANTGEIKKSSIKRLAIAKGLIEPQDNPTTDAMRLGDDIEMTIYEELKIRDDRWQSNYKLVSEKYSKKNVSLIAHIDFFLKDDDNKVINIVECKATKTSTMETYQTYKNQLFIEYMLAKEYALSLKGRWKVKMKLCHYDTNDMMMFESAKITMKDITFKSMPFDIERGMKIIDDYMEGMDAYYEDDEVDANMLPEKVQEQFAVMTNILHEIKEREQQVEEFKKKIYEFFVEHNIKSVKNSSFTISRVDPSVSKSFDYKKYLADFEKKHPRKYIQIIKQYEKTTNRKGYVNIKIK